MFLFLFSFLFGIRAGALDVFFFARVGNYPRSFENSLRNGVCRRGGRVVESQRRGGVLGVRVEVNGRGENRRLRRRRFGEAFFLFLKILLRWFLRVSLVVSVGRINTYRGGMCVVQQSQRGRVIFYYDFVVARHGSVCERGSHHQGVRIEMKRPVHAKERNHLAKGRGDDSFQWPDALGLLQKTRESRRRALRCVV